MVWQRGSNALYYASRVVGGGGEGPFAATYNGSTFLMAITAAMCVLLYLAIY